MSGDEASRDKSHRPLTPGVPPYDSLTGTAFITCNWAQPGLSLPQLIRLALHNVLL
jgi:hypothetical protein